MDLQALEKATTSYIKAKSSMGDRAARHATRAVLLQMDLLRKGGNKQQARVHQEDKFTKHSRKP